MFFNSLKMEYWAVNGQLMTPCCIRCRLGAPLPRDMTASFLCYFRLRGVEVSAVSGAHMYTYLFPAVIASTRHPLYLPTESAPLAA